MEMRMSMAPATRQVQIMECPLCEANVGRGVDWQRVADRALRFATEPDYSICPHCGNPDPIEQPTDAVSALAAIADSRRDEWRRRVEAWRRVILRKLGFSMPCRTSSLAANQSIHVEGLE